MTTDGVLSYHAAPFRAAAPSWRLRWQAQGLCSDGISSCIKDYRRCATSAESVTACSAKAATATRTAAAAPSSPRAAATTS